MTDYVHLFPGVNEPDWEDIRKSLQNQWSHLQGTVDVVDLSSYVVSKTRDVYRKVNVQFTINIDTSLPTTTPAVGTDAVEEAAGRSGQQVARMFQERVLNPLLMEIAKLHGLVYLGRKGMLSENDCE